MSMLLLWVCGGADEIWIRVPAELCELCVKWFAAWVSTKTKPVSHCLPSVSLTGWLSEFARLSSFLCVCQCVHSCVSTCSTPVSLSVCALLPVASGAIHCSDEPGDLARQTEMMWRKLPLTTSVSRPPPSPNDRQSAVSGCCMYLNFEGSLCYEHTAFSLFLSITSQIHSFFNWNKNYIWPKL